MAAVLSFELTSFASVAVYCECKMTPASGGGLGPGMRHLGCETTDMGEELYEGCNELLLVVAVN